MEENWSEKLRNFDRVWQRVTKHRPEKKCRKDGCMPRKQAQSRNTRFHGGR